MSSLFFSLIIPTYNRASFIRRTLESALCQEFDSFEIIVVDDGGSDNTQEIIESIGSEKIIYYRKENGERGAARNFGCAKARGQYITFLDSDDILYPNHFKEAYSYLSQRKDVISYAQAYEVRYASNNKLLRKAYQFSDACINKHLLKGNMLGCFGVFVRKEVFSEIGFSEDRRFSGTEDWLLWLQLSARYPFYYNNMITGAMLEHDDRSVLSFNEASLSYRAEGIKKKLLNDNIFVKKYNAKQINNIYAHMLSYSSLHLIMSNQRKKAIQYWLKAIRINTAEISTKRSVAIFKKVLFS